MSANVRLTLLAHGMTAAMSAGRFPIDEPLSDLGVRQIDALGELRPFDRVLAGPETRTRQTAQHLGRLPLIEPALADLPGVARTFLLAMAHDDGPSKMSDIASRLKVDANYASQYRLRLIATELIEPVGHGRVDFTMPYLRDYLREHVALDAQRELPTAGLPSNEVDRG